MERVLEGAAAKMIRSQSMVAGFVSIFIVAPVTWMLLDRTPPYVRTSGMIEPNEAMPGSTITVRWTLREIRYCPLDHRRVTTRRVTDRNGIEHRYAPTSIDYDVDKPMEIVRSVQLPANIVPGPATYHSETCYACNPFQEMWPVCVTTPDIPFIIVGAHRGGDR